MKVLVVGTGGSIVSGISTAADDMVRILTDMGHLAERVNSGERMRRRANSVNLENVRAVLGDAVTVARRARRSRADVVWIHTFGVPALPALRALAMVVAVRVTRRRAVVHLHAFGLERSVADGGRPLRIILGAVGVLAAGVVVVHEAAADALRGVVRDGSLHVLHNGVELPEAVAALPAQPPLRLVFVGGLVRRKGAPQLIQAMRLLDGAPVELRLVGGAGEDGPAALEQLEAGASDLVRDGRVSFAGELDGAGVRAALRAGHVFVLPSEAEGMPISMLEAMAEGRAVLVTDAGNMRSVVETTGCGWMLEDREPVTIAARVREIAEDPQALAQASRRAHQAVTTEYSTTAQRPRIEGILASIR